MNMRPTYQQTSALLGKALSAEAKRCVQVHGRGGQGDPLGADNILACRAAYVATCVERELHVNTANKVAQDLQRHFDSVWEQWDRGTDFTPEWPH